jgi:prepilin-type processing-associated H-X9-DG protein/prepilin-type N-terminal cleavage/methylation domain-containing protein
MRQQLNEVSHRTSVRAQGGSAGFTLVELLVVIGIIALLMGILLPTLGKVNERSKATKCLNNIRQIGLACQAYLQNPSSKDFHVPAYWGWSQSTPPWRTSSPPPGYDSTLTPARRWWIHNSLFKQSLGVSDNQPENGRYPQGLQCPVAPMPQDRANAAGQTLHNSYSMNFSQLPGLNAAMAPMYWQAWKRQMVLSPSEKIQFCDGTSEGVSVHNNVTAKPNATLLYFDTYYGGERHEGPDWGGAVAFRHMKGANVLYFDGHAGWRSMAELRVDPSVPDTVVNLKQWQPRVR